MFKKEKNNKVGLNIIIVGLGKVGNLLVEQLVAEGHDITVIDREYSKIEAVTNVYDVMGIVGNGASYSIQSEAGVDKADLFIAVTGSDEMNLLCCTVAKRNTEISTIARVRTPDYSMEVDYFSEKLGLAMIINPDLVFARAVSKNLSLSTALDVTSFAHGKVDMVRIKVLEDNKLCDTSIADLGRQGITEGIVICAIERDNKIFIPSGDFIIRPGDNISFVAPSRGARAWLKKIGFKTNQVKNTLIVGGGRAAYYVAKNLVRNGIDVTIIEENVARGEKLSALIPDATIVNGDGTSEEFLREQGIETVDSFIPLTGIDEENILLALHAKQITNAKVITRIRRNNFMGVMTGLDLGTVIYPKNITSDAIVAYVRAKKNSLNCNIETLYHMLDSRAEAIEFKVEKQSEVCDIPLFKLSLKKDLLIAFINRDRKIIIPKGQDCIKTGDTVMIVTTHTGFKDIQDILA